MQTPLEIKFRNMDRSAAVEAAIEERLEKLERSADNIVSCRVTVEAPHKHHSKGNIYHVTIDLRVPGAEIIVNRDADHNHAHEDVYVAVRDAVNAASRQLKDHVRISRGKVKAHETPLHGRVAEVHTDSDYGRVETPDGRLVYFHRNSLLNSTLEQLEPGAEVRFTEEAGDKGPQASSIQVIGKHHIVG